MKIALSIAVIASLTCLSAHADEAAPAKKAVTNIIGKVQLPKQISEGINVKGLSLVKAVAHLKGKYNYPRLPYPKNWREMTPEKRRAWMQEFEKSEAYQERLRKIKVAKAKRFSIKTQVAEDGSFSFKGISPQWYELTVTIMHPSSKGEPNSEQARAHALRQFFVKKVDRDHNLGLITFKVKNVLMPSDLAPDFAVQKYDSGEFKLSDYRGKFVLFDFWATWCGPCIAEMPNLEAAHKKYGGDRLAVIGLSVDQKIDTPKAYLKKKKSGYTQGYVGDAKRYTKISEAYGITSIPSIWLIGPDGTIIARDLRSELLRDAVAEAMKTD